MSVHQRVKLTITKVERKRIVEASIDVIHCHECGARVEVARGAGVVIPEIMQRGEAEDGELYHEVAKELCCSRLP